MRFKPSFFLLISAFILASCQVTVTSPIETSPILPTSIPTAVPTLVPTQPIKYPQVITGENAGGLKKVAEYKTNQPMQLVWLKNSQVFWVINDSSAVQIDIQTGKSESVFNAVNPGQILSASSDGDTILFLDPNQKEIGIFNRKLNNTLMINPETLFASADFSPDGTRISIPSLDKLEVSIWDVQSASRLTTLQGFETAAPVYNARIGADNRSLIWYSRATLQLQNLDNQRMGPRFSHEDFVTGFDLASNGRILASSAGGTINGVYSPLIYLWDTQSGSNLASIAYPDSISALAFSPDGKILAGASAGNLILWDMTTFKVINIIQGQSKTIYTLSFSPDGKSLLSSSLEDNLVKLWQVLQ